MSEAEMLYKYNVDDEALERIFNERDEVIEARIREAERRADEHHIWLQAKSHERFCALEKKTRRLQWRANLLFSGLFGVVGGLALSAACSHDWISMIAMLLVGAIFALSWAVIGR